MTHKIEILGAGCAKCQSLKKSAEAAVKIIGWNDAEIIYTTEMEKIIDRGIMTTPALFLDGLLLVSGKYLPPNKLVELFKEKDLLPN